MHKQFPDIPLPHLIVSVCGKLRSYRLARNLDDNSIPEPIFWLPNKPPEGWNVNPLLYKHISNIHNIEHLLDRYKEFIIYK